LALIGGFVGALYILDLQCVRRTGSVVTHTEKINKTG
jgi:hypothetical protein